MSPRRLPLALTISAALLLLAPAAAGASFQTLYDDYSADGVIDGCAYSAGDLSAGLNDIPADVREYDPGFSDAINAALEQVASGCHASLEKVAPIRNEISAPDGSPGPARPKGIALAAAGDGRGMPGVLVAVMVVLAAALGAAGFAAGRRFRGGASSPSRPKSSDF